MSRSESITSSYGTNPVYLTNNTFALTGFNTVSEAYSIPVATAAAAANLKLTQAIASFGANASTVPIRATDPSKEHGAQNMLAANSVHSG